MEKIYTIELKKVLTTTSKDIIEEYPSDKILLEHFILSLLSDKKCMAYNLLLKISSVTAIEAIYDYYAQKLHDKSESFTLKQIKKTKIGYDSILSGFLKKSEDEKLKLGDKLIGSEHVMLSIIYDENNINAKKFHAAGIKYDTLFSEIQESKELSNQILSSVENAIDVMHGNKLENEQRTKPDSINSNKYKSKKSNSLETYCVNINQLARQNKIDDLIGRENEINRIIKIMGRRNKNNVVLVGLPGVGKTALPLGLAKKIENGEAMFLNGKTIWSLNIASIIAGTTYRGMLEERMHNILNEIKLNDSFILFIDDVHNILNSSISSSSEISGILSNALSEGNIQLMATTTFKDYKNTIENNPTLSRRFQKIIIEPSNVDESIKILEKVKIYYENFHNVRYSDNAIKTCVNLANKYINDRQLPDSAIDILDECGSGKKLYNPKMDQVIELKAELIINENLRDNAFNTNDFVLGDKYSTTCKELKAKIIDFEKKMNYSTNNSYIEIDESDIYNTVSEMINVPITKLTVSDKQKFLDIEKILNSKIIGQEEAIKKISQTIRRNRVGLGRKNKPVATFLSVGVSGVGKTLLAKKLAEEIYGGENSLVRFDMSEFSDKTSINKLIGAGSGYVGFEQGGLLTEAIKNKKHCVLLLDEIEKADKEVLNIFLQVFDDGMLTDNTGQKVSFKNVIIIMTSNVGTKAASLFSRGAGFTSNIEENKKNILGKSLKEHFPIEFLNRLDATIYFNELDENNLKSIIELELNSLKERLSELKFNIKFTPNIINHIFDNIKKDETPGARKINRYIQAEIEDQICNLYLENEYDENYCFNIEIENNKLKIN